MKYAILIPLFIFGFSVTRAAEKAPTQFSTRTEAAVALWNKASPIPASNEFRVAMQRFENAATAFQEASFAIAPDAVFQTAVADANLSATLNAYKQAALEMLAALHAYQQQEREELRRTRQPTEQQNQILQKQTDSFRMFDEWGAAAVQAADAGLAIRSLVERGLPFDKAKLHWVLPRLERLEAEVVE